ncbi:MAG: uncharacterized protein A8A55_0152 [Amphiamblys sp. WSBS2006]|nr:MAG: uncharacterized protein A8A55_0152 [Amphiamblys sp. WSBS2006]
MDGKGKEPLTTEQLLPSHPVGGLVLKNVLFCIPKCLLLHGEGEEATRGEETERKSTKRRIGKICVHKSGKVVFEIGGKLLEPVLMAPSGRSEFIMHLCRETKTASVMAEIERHVVFSLCPDSFT